MTQTANSEIVYHGDYGLITKEYVQISKIGWFGFARKRKYKMSAIANVEVSTDFWRGKYYTKLPFLELPIGAVSITAYFFTRNQISIATIKPLYYLFAGIFEVGRGLLGIWNWTRKDVQWVIANIKPSHVEGNQTYIVICNEFEAEIAEDIAARIRACLES
jgi:hypothetical protein